MNPKFQPTKFNIDYQHIANPGPPLFPVDYFKANPRCHVVLYNKILQ